MTRSQIKHLAFSSTDIEGIPKVIFHREKRNEKTDAKTDCEANCSEHEVLIQNLEGALEHSPVINF